MRRTICFSCLLGVALLLHPGCARDELCPRCGGDAPADSLSWMKDLTQSDQVDAYSWFKRFCYEGQTVFVQGNCCETCLAIWAPLYFDCDGRRLEFADPEAVIDVWTVSGENVWSGSECAL